MNEAEKLIYEIRKRLWAIENMVDKDYVAVHESLLRNHRDLTSLSRVFHDASQSTSTEVEP